MVTYFSVFLQNLQSSLHLYTVCFDLKCIVHHSVFVNVIYVSVNVISAIQNIIINPDLLRNFQKGSYSLIFAALVLFSLDYHCNFL
jgi:hypothetical protein